MSPYNWTRKPSMAVHLREKSVKQLVGHFRDALPAVDTSQNAAQIDKEEISEVASLEECALDECDATRRWKAFETFKRAHGGEMVMESPDGIVKDFMPGNYNVKELVMYPSLAPIKPSSTVVYGICWEDGKPGQPGKVIFPNSFSGQIAAELATSEHLEYYGALLCESNKAEKILLESRHVMDDYTYSPDYMKWVESSAGGAGLEFHDFAHLDCPLNCINTSGFFVMARFNNTDRTELELTAFQVPKRHTVYTPPGVIHTNSYLRGTWRTLLSDQPVKESKMMRRTGKKFHFTIDGGLLDTCKDC